MAQALSDIYNSLNSGGYDAQRQAINQQLSTVPAYYQAQQQGLDQQETNQFRNITNDAAARGMSYSGAPIQEEQQYVGGTYLPALAQLKQQQNQQTYGLQQALAGVSTAQTNAAQGILQNQIQNDQQNNYYNQMLRQNALYNQNQLNLSARYVGGGGGGGAAANPYAATRNAGGGWNFTQNGNPITANQYAQATGTSVAALLAGGSAGDRQLAQQYQSANAAQRAQIVKSHPWIFG